MALKILKDLEWDNKRITEELQKRLKRFETDRIPISLEKSGKHIDSEELKNAVREWIDSFNKGKCWTDFAADSRNGQENIVEWIEYFFNLRKQI